MWLYIGIFSIQCINKQKELPPSIVVSRLSAENPEPAYKTNLGISVISTSKIRGWLLEMRVFLIRNIKTDCHKTYEEDWKQWENPVQRISLKMALITTYDNRILQPTSSTSIVITFSRFSRGSSLIGTLQSVPTGG